MPGRVQSGGSFYQQQRQLQQQQHNMTRKVSGGGGNPNHPHHHFPNGGNPNHYPPHHQQQLQQQHYGKQGRKEKMYLDSYLADDVNFPSFKMQMQRLGLQLRDIPADGNCLFRALGDQLEGHCRSHFRHRADVVAFMKENRVDFEPFVEDDVSFDDHVRNLQRLGTHAGNDAIVAFAKLNQVNVVIHQLNGKPLMIQGPSNSNNLTRQLHIAYHNGDHYSSVRRLDDNTESPAHICWFEEPKDSASSRMPVARDSNAGVVSVTRGLEEIEREVMIATQCMDINRVRDILIEYDYDEEAAIADLMQQMELTGDVVQDDCTSLASQQTSTDSGVFNPSSPGAVRADNNNNNNDHSSGNSSPNSSNGRMAGSVLKINGQGSVNGKGHKVHFREDSFGGNSSGYGSVSSERGGGARPKVTQQLSAKKMKENKKLEKKKRAEERHRQKLLGGGMGQVAGDVRNVMVVENGRQPQHSITLHGRLTTI